MKITNQRLQYQQSYEQPLLRMTSNCYDINSCTKALAGEHEDGMSKQSGASPGQLRNVTLLDPRQLRWLLRGVLGCGRGGHRLLRRAAQYQR